MGMIRGFQSSFELTGYITNYGKFVVTGNLEVSKLFRAYGLYNEHIVGGKSLSYIQFQSSFELTGYITSIMNALLVVEDFVSKLFRAYGLYNNFVMIL